MARLWQYQRIAQPPDVSGAPTPPPTLTWLRPQNEPNPAWAKVRRAAFIAAVPAFFFIGTPPAAAPVPEIPQIQNQSPQRAKALRPSPYSFFVEVQKDDPVAFGLQPVLPKRDSRHLYPYFFAPVDMSALVPATEWNSLGGRGTAQDGITGPTLTITTTGDINAGEVAVVIIACDNVDAGDVQDPPDIALVKDSAGNNYVRAKSYRNGNSGLSTGATVGIYFCRLGSTLSSGGTVTITLSANLPGKAASIHAFSILPGRDVGVDGASVRSDDVADPGAISLSGVTAVERLWVHAVAHEGPNSDSFTQDANYTSIAGDGTSSGGPGGMSIRGGYRIQSAASDTVDVTYTAADHAQALVALRQVVLGSGELEAAHHRQFAPVKRPFSAAQVAAIGTSSLEPPVPPPAAPEIPFLQQWATRGAASRVASRSPYLFAPEQAPAPPPSVPDLAFVQPQPQINRAQRNYGAQWLFSPPEQPAAPTIPDLAYVAPALPPRAARGAPWAVPHLFYQPGDVSAPQAPDIQFPALWGPPGGLRRTPHLWPAFFAHVAPPPPPPPAPDIPFPRGEPVPWRYQRAPHLQPSVFFVDEERPDVPIPPEAPYATLRAEDKVLAEPIREIRLRSRS